MKHKRLNRDGWGFQYYPYYQMRIDDEIFHGLACLIRLTDGEVQYWETPKAGRIQVTGAGMTWLELIPDQTNRVITIKYFPDGTHDCERKQYPDPVNVKYQPSIWYVDITDGMEFDDDGIAVYIDKYLDVIFTQEGDVIIDDRDELDAAYQSGELSAEQYHAALEEADAILHDLCSDIPKTNVWCAQIRQIVEERIANGEAIKKCREVLEKEKAVCMENNKIIDKNRDYWNEHADLWFGTTALPEYGVRFPTENDLHLFGDVRGKKMLEICCGSGHSLKYNAEKGAGELYGVDLSQKQLDNAAGLLLESGYSAKLICAKMEEELDVPKEYFDYVYSIYGIGWTTDLQGTFDHIASYLKKDGIFIFSWHHTLHYCVAWSCAERKDVIEDDKLVLMKSYYDESYFHMPVHDSEIVLCNRKISTYINALAKAGFVVEQLIEETDENTLMAQGDVDPKTRKAQMMPISFCIKARKL